MHGGFQTKPTTLSQWQVIAWLFVCALLLAGGLLVYYSFGQPLEKQDAAMQARWSGLWSLGTGAVFAGLLVVVRRYVHL